MSNKQSGVVDALFLARGYEKRGGIWGDAQWIMINRDLIVSIGGAFRKGNTLLNDDFLMAPEQLDRPCLVRVYRGPFSQDSLDDWDRHDRYMDGPMPKDYEDMSAYQMLEILSDHVFGNVADALTFVDGIIANGAPTTDNAC